MRLIDAEELTFRINDDGLGYNMDDFDKLCGLITNAPTICEPPRYGHWEKEFTGEHVDVCSNCGCRFSETIWFNPRMYDYCPNCGAKMKVESD